MSEHLNLDHRDLLGGRGTSTDKHSAGYWWRAKPADRARAAVEWIKRIDRDQAYKYNMALRAVRLYGDPAVSSLAPSEYNRRQDYRLARIVLRFNLVESIVNTLVAHVTSNVPKVSVLTTRGNKRQQMTAKKMEQLLMGAFRESGLYAEADSVYRDAALVGLGAARISLRGNKVVAERVFIDQLVWDDADAINGRPANIAYRNYISRGAAYEWASCNGLPEKALLAIKEAPPATGPQGESAPSPNSDQIVMYEIWYTTPDGNGKRGVYTEATKGEVLFEDYCHPRPPIVLLPYGTKPPKGLVPRGVAEVLVGLQVSINRHLETIEAILKTMAVPRVYIEEGSQINSSQMSNLVAQIIQYPQGTKTPVVDNSVGLAPELWQQIASLIDQGHQLVGISQLATGGRRPAGLNSGEALREYSDIGSVRLVNLSRAYEQFFVDCAEVVLWLLSDLYKGGVDSEIKAPQSRFLNSIKWSEVESLLGNPYVLQRWPSSSLPATPAGKMATVDEWVQRGWISREQALQLMELPDLQEANSSMTAALDDIQLTIEGLLMEPPPSEQGPYTNEQDKAEAVYRKYVPDPAQNLAMGIPLVHAAWLEARHQKDIKPERRQLLLDWISEAQGMLQAEQAEQAALAAQSGQVMDPSSMVDPTTSATEPAL